MSYGKIAPMLAEVQRERSQPDPPDRAADVAPDMARDLPPARELNRATPRNPTEETMQPFLAYIMPVGGGVGGPGGPGGPGGIGPPLGFWGGRPPEYVDIGGPGPQPPGSPGQPPLGIWGGYRPPYVDAGPPGPQPPWGAHPAHPIWRPDLGFWGGRPPPYVDIGLPGQQPGIWPNPPEGQAPIPSHPIVLPPDLPPEMPDPDNRPIEWKTGWTPQTGWVVVGVPQGPTPTPSKK